MGHLWYALAVLMIIAWLIGFVGYNLGSLMHILLVGAIVSFVFSAKTSHKKT